MACDLRWDQFEFAAVVLHVSWVRMELRISALPFPPAIAPRQDVRLPGFERGRERIRQNGRFTILLPREIDPTAAGARMPLPPVKALRSEPAIQPATNLAGSGERGGGIAAAAKHENARPSTRDRRADLPQNP
jgi:hypothetical protein